MDFLWDQKIFPTKLKSYHVSQYTHKPDSIENYTNIIIKLKLLGFFKYHYSSKKILFKIL